MCYYTAFNLLKEVFFFIYIIFSGIHTFKKQIQRNIPLMYESKIGLFLQAF